MRATRFAQLGARHDLAREGARRHEQHAPRPVVRQVIERRHAAHRGAPVGAHVGVGRRLAGREDEHVALAGVLGVVVGGAPDEEADVFGGAARGVEVGRDEDDARARPGDGRGERRARAARGRPRRRRGRRSQVRGAHAPDDVAEARRDDALGRQEGRERLELDRQRQRCQLFRGPAGLLLQGRGQRRRARHGSAGYVGRAPATERATRAFTRPRPSRARHGSAGGARPARPSSHRAR